MSSSLTNYSICSRLNSCDLAGAPYSFADTLADKLGVSRDNPIVARIAYALGLGGIPAAINHLTQVKVGLGSRHLLAMAYNFAGAACDLVGATRRLNNGQNEEAMLHAARATLQVYRLALNAAVIGGGFILGKVYGVNDLPIVELAGAVVAPRTVRGIYQKVSEAPEQGVINFFGIEKPYIIRVQIANGSIVEIPITKEEKQKIEKKEFKSFSINFNEATKEYEIKFSTEEASVAPSFRDESASRVRRVASAREGRKIDSSAANASRKGSVGRNNGVSLRHQGLGVGKRRRRGRK